MGDYFGYNEVFINTETSSNINDLIGGDIPVDFSLSQNYPNPFNCSTTIYFSLPKAEGVKIEIFNSVGQKIRTLLDVQMPTGSHKVIFDAPDLPSGLFIYRIFAGDFTDQKKCLLLK